MKDTKKAWRLKYPIKAAYSTLRDNAKRRGIQFTITLQYFEDFAIKTKLMTSRGRNVDSLTVDRINVLKGYVEGNLQALKLAHNGYKGYLEREIYYREGDGLRSKLRFPDTETYEF